MVFWVMLSMLMSLTSGTFTFVGSIIAKEGFFSC